MPKKQFRQIHTKMWKDGWFIDLAPDEKLLFVYLITNDAATIAGIYELSPSVIRFETGLEAEQIESAFEIFAEAGRAFYDGRVVFVRNLRRYHETESHTVQKRIMDDFDSVPDCEIKRLYAEEYDIDTVSIPYQNNTADLESRYGIDRVSGNTSTSTSIYSSESKSKSFEQMIEALAYVCGIDAEIPDNRRKLERTAAQLAPKYDASIVLERYAKLDDNGMIGEWYRDDWRGQRGQLPTPALISMTIALPTFGKPDPKRALTQAEIEAQYDEYGVMR